MATTRRSGTERRQSGREPRRGRRAGNGAGKHQAPVLLGVDGGGSKTRALVTDEEGRVLGAGEAGPSNPNSVGRRGSGAALLAAVRAAMHAATGTRRIRRVRAACFGLAGTDTPEDSARVARWLERHGIAERVVVVNDGELLLAAGTPEGWGLAIISGTGSIAFGRSPDGRRARAGGWGHVIGDEGSGYAISIDALRLGVQTADARAEAHALLQAVLAHLQLGRPEDLLHWVYAPERTKADIAALCPVVFELAHAGDAWAASIIEQAGDALAKQAQAVLAQLELVAAPLALGGSLLCRQSLLRESLVRRLGGAVSVVTPVGEPARGAVTIAQHFRSGPQEEWRAPRKAGTIRGSGAKGEGTVRGGSAR